MKFHSLLRSTYETNVDSKHNLAVKGRKRTPREITLPPRGYQPSRAELCEEFDMPRASIETVRNAFFRPVVIREKEPGK